MNHVIIGSLLPFVIGLGVYWRKGGSLPLHILWPTSMALGALYAVIPDIPRVLGMHELYISLSNNPKCDIFLWHYSIDMRESDSLIFMLTFLAQVTVMTLSVLQSPTQIKGSS